MILFPEKRVFGEWAENGGKWSKSAGLAVSIMIQ